MSLFIGCGFNSDETILNYIQMLSHNLKLVVILKDDDNLEGLVSFISSFKDREFNASIIINIKVNDVIINYYLDPVTKFYNESKIKAILENMLLIESQIDSDA